MVLVASPHATHGDHLEAAVTALRSIGVEVGLRLIVDALDTQQSQGAAWREAGHSAVIAAGGDGTIGAVASHIAGSALNLGILPLGSSNDIARSLGVPLQVERAVETIAAGYTLTMDAGQVVPAVTEPHGLRRRDRFLARVSGKSAPSRGAYFLHTATVGLNVQFAQLATDSERRERFGALNYATALLETMLKMEPIETTIHFTEVHTVDGVRDTLEVQTRALQIAALNTPVFGGGMNLRVPDVSPRDELLDFIVIEPFNPSQLGVMAQALLSALASLGAHLFGQTSAAEQAKHAPNTPGVQRYQARAASIATATPMEATLDGEIRARTPMIVRVAPEKLRVYLPAEAGTAFLEHERQAEADAIPKEAERGV
jgi:diacylglycerol kinase (ATP)